MDYQNAEFYRLNKNNTALIFNFENELITYRKETDNDGNLQIVEYRKVDSKKGKKVTTRRVLRPYEMSVEAFDAWKAKLTEEALEYRRHDDLTTRQNISIENLLDTDLSNEESLEDEYLREEEEKQARPKTMKEALDILNVLTPTQRSRYIKHIAYGKTVREIAAEEGCYINAVEKSLMQAEKKIAKEREKRGF